ncbi:MAG TPA: YegS/Rv2252/BmrU family lipid kinase [Flavisolibacter sp.]|nr:YegS/Rv2252/BmrU family lipid kinase [Flavisolibacter sp.]
MSFPEKHIAIVCNPTRENSKALKIADEISILLSGMDISHSIFIKDWPIEWTSFTEAWICGGDGTLNYFINKYPNLHLPVSIFKGGSGNDFHWMLYGNLTIEQQVEKLLSGTIHFVDGGTCNGKLFLNGVGIGFDGEIVKDLLGKNKLAGKATYMLSVLKNISVYKEKTYSVQTDKELINSDYLMISVANASRYGGGFHVAPNAKVNDGLLDLCLIGKISPLKRIKYLPVIEKGQHLSLSFVQYLQLNKVTITSSSKIHAHLDGEYIYSDIFEINCLPERFRFIW